MAHRGWLLAGVLAVGFAVGCKKSDTKEAAAGSAAPVGSAAAGSAASGGAVSGSAAVTATPVDAAPAEEPLKVGETVWTKAEAWGDNHARRGKILKINANGTYRLSFEDTDDADMDAASLSRTKPGPKTVANDGGPALQVGDAVDGLWSDNRWYPGKIGKINDDGTYFINFNDGDKAALDASHVRRRKAASGGGSSKAAGGEPCNEGPDWTRCPGIGCHRLTTDNQNCGACGHHCAANNTCKNGTCVCNDSDGDCTN